MLISSVLPLVVFGLAVGVEGCELGGRCVPVQVDPHPPPAGHQQALTLAGPFDQVQFVTAECDAVLDQPVALAVLELAVPLVRARALHGAQFWC